MQTNLDKRRNKILAFITNTQAPVSGSELSSMFGVSRQIIVSDISALKALGHDIISTNRGYILHKPQSIRVVKVFHTDEEIGDELLSIAELGATVVDVFVWHKIYGKIEAALNISSKRDVNEYLKSLKSGRSGPLKKVTSDYHYHTLRADNEKILDDVEKMLDKKGYLVKEED